MTATDSLKRKNVQVDLSVWKEIMKRKSAKEMQLAKQGHPREVTLGEVVADAMGVKV
jgi:hypothetical protein